MKENRGSATLEATLIVPLLIFAILFIYNLGCSKMSEEVLYEGVVETVEYVSEYAYLANEDFPMYNTTAYRVFSDYVDRPELLEKYIKGGSSGVKFLVTGPDEDNYIQVKVSYEVQVKVPLFGTYSKGKSYVVKQKAYLGYKPEDSKQGDDVDEREYVYITDNREAYHITRECTHLKLSISPATKSLATKGGYTPCEFCYAGEDRVYVTDWGNRYHSSKGCSGLKRTVYIVEKSQVPELPPCSRCGYE